MTLISAQTRLLGNRILTRLADIHATVKASSEEQKHLLEQVIDKLDQNSKQIRAGNAVTTNTWDAQTGLVPTTGSGSQDLYVENFLHAHSDI